MGERECVKQHTNKLISRNLKRAIVIKRMTIYLYALRLVCSFQRECVFLFVSNYLNHITVVILIFVLFFAQMPF